jgi:hypothetical protein
MDKKESYAIRSEEVNSSSKLTVKLAPGGGNAIYLEEITE